MFIILLIPIFLILLFRLCFFKSRFTPNRKSGDFVIALYLMSILIGVVLYILYPDEIGVYEPSIVAMLYLSVAFIIYFFPLIYFQDRTSYKLDILDKTVFKLLSVFFLTGSLFSISILLPKVITAFKDGAANNRLLLNTGEFVVFEGSFIETIAVGFSAFFSFVQIIGLLIVFFRIFGKKSNFIGSLMLLSSTSYIFNALAFAGRDGVIFWTFSFIFNYFMLKTWFGLTITKSLSRKIWLVFILFFAIVLSITLSRFSSNAWYSIFSYFAQQLTNFNDLYILDPPIYNGSLNFYILKNHIMTVTLHPGDLNYYYLSNDVYPWIFKFFIGSFVSDFGKINTLIILLFLSISIFITIIRKNKTYSRKISIYHVLLFSFYGQIGYMGLFYFKHSALNNYILALLTLSLVLYFFKLTTKRSYIL